MGTSPYVNNSVLISLIFSHFIEKKYFYGNMGTYKIGEVPLEYRPKVRGRSLKLHIEIKSKRVVYGWMYMCPQKKKTKKRRSMDVHHFTYGLHPFICGVSFAPWCELARLLHGVKLLCAVLSTIGRGCPYDATLTFSPRLLFHRTLVGFIHEWNQVLGSSIPSSFFSNKQDAAEKEHIIIRRQYLVA
jgi:hypothetical protein